MGRRSLKDEQLISKVVNKSWKIINKALEGKSYSKEDKSRIALEIVKRTCPQNINNKHTVDEEAINTLAGLFLSD